MTKKKKPSNKKKKTVVNSHIVSYPTPAIRIVSFVVHLIDLELKYIFIKSASANPNLAKIKNK